MLSEQPNVGSGFGDDAETPDLKHHPKLNMGPHLELGINRVQKSIHKCKGIKTHFLVTSYNFMLDVLGIYVPNIWPGTCVVATQPRTSDRSELDTHGIYEVDPNHSQS